MAETLDFVIVDAESVGCAPANRLSENYANCFLRMEAGGQHHYIHMPIPAGLMDIVNVSKIQRT